MEKQISLIEGLCERTSNYAQKSVELYKLKAIDKTADVISTLAARLVFISIFCVSVLIINIGVALWLGEILGVNYYGFFSVAAFYAFIGFVLYVFRNKLVKEPVRDSIITEALK